MAGIGGFSILARRADDEIRMAIAVDIAGCGNVIAEKARRCASI